jgi:hypothetical protein
VHSLLTCVLRVRCQVAGSLAADGGQTALRVRPRHRHGETADSYLRRLAAANHLRFSYLRLYVASRRGSYDPVDPARLAALAGREPHAIPRAFPELAPAAPGRPDGAIPGRKSSGTGRPGGRSTPRSAATPRPGSPSGPS